MIHLHFSELSSTQDYLRDHLNVLMEDSSRILISTKRQTKGVGRRDKVWHHVKNALAFSFTLSPGDPMGLNPLRVGVLLVEYLKTKSHRVYLKWPNDLINGEKKKCGGIVSWFSKDTLVIGVGINWGMSHFEGSYNTPPGVIDKSCELSGSDFRDLPREIYHFILKQEMGLVREKWLENCMHLHQQVYFKEDERVQEGRFVDIGSGGEAVLECKDQIKRVYTGSLSLSR